MNYRSLSGSGWLSQGSWKGEIRYGSEEEPLLNPSRENIQYQSIEGINSSPLRSGGLQEDGLGKSVRVYSPRAEASVPVLFQTSADSASLPTTFSSSRSSSPSSFALFRRWLCRCCKPANSDGKKHTKGSTAQPQRLLTLGSLVFALLLLVASAFLIGFRDSSRPEVSLLTSTVVGGRDSGRSTGSNMLCLYVMRGEIGEFGAEDGREEGKGNFEFSTTFPFNR